MRLSLHHQYLLICFNFISTFNVFFTKASSNSVSFLFTKYYSKDVTEDTLKKDIHTLEPLVCRFETFVEQSSQSTLKMLQETIVKNLASNKRLQDILTRKEPRLKIRKDGKKMKRFVVENLINLLVTLELTTKEDELMKDRFFGEVNETLNLQLDTSGWMNEGTIFTLHSDDGFKHKVIEVLFEKTGPLRKKDTFPKPNIVSSSRITKLVEFNTTTGTSIHSVPLTEVLDEIVWLCVLRSCVNPDDIFKQGLLIVSKSDASSKNEAIEQLYIELYIARVKCLLYLAFIEPLLENQDEQPEEDTTKARIVPKSEILSGLLKCKW